MATLNDHINADFSKRVLVHSDELPWIKSPMPGVDRRALDRVGGEIARATSIVRYAAGSKFSGHVHTGGEEFVVLEGMFQDENGDYPAGTYVRNPPESSHVPYSNEGCVIFVKLWQFQPSDRHQSVSQIASLDGQTLLHSDAHEEVSYFNVPPNTELNVDAQHGIEVLVLSGSVADSDETLHKHSWLRLPIGSHLNAKSGSEGATLWLKRNHLNDVNKQIERVQGTR
jgi:hypothetical protein